MSGEDILSVGVESVDGSGIEFGFEFGVKGGEGDEDDDRCFASGLYFDIVDFYYTFAWYRSGGYTSRSPAWCGMYIPRTHLCNSNGSRYGNPAPKVDTS